MKKLGIVIPYYKNSEECEIQFKKLLDKLNKQLTNEVMLCIIEDGQNSEWIKPKNNLVCLVLGINKGVSVARNAGVSFLINKCEYITFIDSDDDISNNYLQEILKCCNGTNEIIQSKMIKRNFLSGKDEDITKRVSVIGYAYRTDVIGNLRFKEHIDFGEDNIFYCNIEQEKRKTQLCEGIYYYQFGINENSLVMKKINVENKK